METIKKIGLILLGVALAVAIAMLVTGIFCAINGVTFSQQIVNWFSNISTSSLTEPVSSACFGLIL